MENLSNFLDKINNLSTIEVLKLENVYKNNMFFILKHYIECNRGYHYNSIFEKVIKPYFDSVEVLESVLRSEVIKNKSNVVIGQTGAKIFPELLDKLMLVDSENIKSYLKNEFKRGS